MPLPTSDNQTDGCCRSNDAPFTVLVSGSDSAAATTEPPLWMEFQVDGLDCHEEVELLKATVGRLPGIGRLEFDLMQGRMNVTRLDAQLDEGHILRAINKTGLRGRRLLDSSESTAETTEHAPRSRWQIPLLAGTMIFAGLVVHAMLTGSLLAALQGELTWRLVNAPVMIFYALGIIAGGWIVWPRAYLSAKSLRADMHVLMSAAVIGAIALGLWLEGAMVMWLFTIALGLEAGAISRARDSINALMSLTPDRAECWSDTTQSWTEISVDDVQEGARLRVSPGQRFPVDGVVIAGNSTAEESMLTGEATPTEKTVHDPVLGGSINGLGSLEIIATRAAADSTAARIGRLVKEARADRSPTEQFVERFAAVYTPLTLIAAIAVGLLPPLVSGGGWLMWIERALVLLVVACPCALVIATPVAMVAAIASLARRGVLIKGSRHLDALARTRCISFDKTGTLTYGEIEVVSSEFVRQTDAERALAIAAGLARQNQHPVSLAMARHAVEAGVAPAKIRNGRVVPGSGVLGHADDRAFGLGNWAFAVETVETMDVRWETEEAESRDTHVYLFDQKAVVARFRLQDEVRHDARDCVQRLRNLGIDHIVMISGDRQQSAEDVAAQVAIGDVVAEALPEDKLLTVRQLQDRHGSVAMVGDGINDGPALAAATVAISLGNRADDLATETSDVVLMNDRLSRLPTSIAHCRRTMRVVYQNVALALIVKLAFVVLAWMGWGTIWMAVAADSGTALIVVANALRLLRVRT